MSNDSQKGEGQADTRKSLDVEMTGRSTVKLSEAAVLYDYYKVVDAAYSGNKLDKKQLEQFLPIRKKVVAVLPYMPTLTEQEATLLSGLAAQLK
ncbi:MAG: hypothetical protein LBK01_08850 [Burkholderiaceae bacterium]|jgi:hypothetical protein|nr:hypothetical protein [Burkholderiaceae bacterium]